MDIASRSIEKFKRISALEVNLKQICLLIGGDNSGKSSFLQGVHFAITTLQSAVMVGGSNGATTLGPDQLIFKLSGDPMLLNNKSPMTQVAGPKFSFTYRAEGSEEDAKFELSVKRGKNANIGLMADSKSPFFSRASDRTRPISIFVPGLAGVALKEEKRTEAILNNGIAQGDSNLYLRNVLLRIIQDADKLDRFHSIIAQIFTGLIISTDYDETRHQYIDVKVRMDGKVLPLEMLGTGCLQAIQLVAYTTMYNPTLLLLDEPDSHLHPSNQRLLASALVSVSTLTSTKVVISTHSRHMFDALARSENCEVVWLKDGQKQEVKDVSDLSLLLDLGALDSFETFASEKNKVVVLTEDSKSQKLVALLEANGFLPGEYFVQPLHGVENVSSAYAVADFFTKLGPRTHVLIHRDGDALLTDEKSWLAERVGRRLPPRSFFFITPLTDVEHQFCQPKHIAATTGISEVDAQRYVDGVISANDARLAVNFANKRQNTKDRSLREKSDAPSADRLLKDRTPFEFCKGKILLGQLMNDLNSGGIVANRIVSVTSEYLRIPELKQFADQAWQRNIPSTSTIDNASSAQTVVDSSSGSEQVH